MLGLYTVKVPVARVRVCLLGCDVVHRAGPGPLWSGCTRHLCYVTVGILVHRLWEGK